MLKYFTIKNKNVLKQERRGFEICPQESPCLLRNRTSPSGDTQVRCPWCWIPWAGRAATNQRVLPALSPNCILNLTTNLLRPAASTVRATTATTSPLEVSRSLLPGLPSSLAPVNLFSTSSRRNLFKNKPDHATFPSFRPLKDSDHVYNDICNSHLA